MLRAALRLSVTAALAGLAVTSTFAQSVISAKSGLIHYIEGDVNVDGTPVSDRLGNFSEIKKGGQMSTELGRAEVLLTPGIFLRASENTTVKMMENRLSDTRVELLSGEAMVESETPMKDNQVTILYKDYAVTVNKHGLYGFETNPAQLKVYSGEAQVSFNGGPLVTVHDGRLWHRVAVSTRTGAASLRRSMYVPYLTDPYEPKGEASKTPLYHYLGAALRRLKAMRRREPARD